MTKTFGLRIRCEHEGKSAWNTCTNATHSEGAVRQDMDGSGKGGGADKDVGQDVKSLQTEPMSPRRQDEPLQDVQIRNELVQGGNAEVFKGAYGDHGPHHCGKELSLLARAFEHV